MPQQAELKTGQSSGAVCECRGDRPGHPVPNKVHGLCRRKATLNLSCRLIRAQELCESRGGRPRLPVPNKSHGFCGRKATLNQTEFYTHNQSWRDISVATKGGILRLFHYE